MPDFHAAQFFVARRDCTASRRTRHNCRVARREDTLIEQIEHDALDDSVPVATALRKCVVLGGKSGSEKLRDWATRELKGYHGDDDLPEYRVVPAPLRIDGLAGNYQVTRQAFPPSGLPHFARDKIKDEVELRGGVGNIDALLQMEEIKLSPPMASDLVHYMNVNAQNQQPHQHIESLYWQVSPAAIRGVLDQIRTSLTQLVAELRATMSSDDAVPSAEAANQAVNVVVTGKRSQVQVTTAQAGGSDTTATATGPQPQRENSPFWTRSRRIGAFIVGLATVAAAVVAIIEFF